MFYKFCLVLLVCTCTGDLWIKVNYFWGQVSLACMSCEAIKLNTPKRGYKLSSTRKRESERQRRDGEKIRKTIDYITQVTKQKSTRHKKLGTMRTCGSNSHTSAMKRGLFAPFW